MTNATATLVPNVTPKGLVGTAELYKLEPAFHGNGYAIGSSITVEQQPLLALFGDDIHVELFGSDENGEDAGPDTALTAPGQTRGMTSVAEAFAAIGYEVVSA